MKVDVNWLRDGVFVGKCDDHAVLMDIPGESQTSTLAPTPMDMLLIGAGGCTSYDVVTLLRDAGQHITDCHVTMRAELRDKAPETFRNIYICYNLTGRGLDQKIVEDAVQQSHTKHSIALISLAGVAEIHSEIKITETEEL